MTDVFKRPDPMFQEDIQRLRDENRVLKATVEELKIKTQPCTKPHEEKMYIILFKFIDSEKHDWEIVTGRTAARDCIIDYCNSYDLKNDDDDIKLIDVLSSKVMVEGRLPELMSTVYQFCKAIEDKYDDGFDINDYLVADPEESEEENDPDREIYANPGAVLSDDQDIERTGNALSDVASNNVESEDV